MSINIFQAVVLGVIEGFTEFLPISSTGHLIIAQKLMGFEKINDFFTVVIQLGAILAAAIYFRKRIITDVFQTRKYVMPLILGILPTLLIGFLFKDVLSAAENSAIFIFLTTTIGGILFYAFEMQYKDKATKELLELKPRHFLLIGLLQGISILPGVSRSGSSITAGTLNRMRIEDSIEYSFLMGIPLILIASIYKLYKYTSSGIGVSTDLLIATFVGFLVSFVVGFLGVKLTLGWVKKYGFKPFMIYRLALGAVLVVLLITGVFKY
jgi:undecaprenyl-diphosphatase